MPAGFDWFPSGWAIYRSLGRRSQTIEMLIRAFIPSYQKIEVEYEKNFTVFVIEVYVGGRRHVMKKRYSEFEELHKKLKKTIHTPEFPPKKVLKWNPKVLELRRQGLETYIQDVLEHHSVPKAIYKFLGVRLSASFESLDDMSDHGACHQPVLAFVSEAFLQEEKGSPTEHMTAAILQGFYSAVNDLW